MKLLSRLRAMALALTAWCMYANCIWAQSGSLFVSSPVTFSALSPAQQSGYDNLMSNHLADTIYLVNMEQLSEVQDSGRVLINLPF